MQFVCDHGADTQAAGLTDGRGEEGKVRVCWPSAAVKFCERRVQTLFTSHAGHMFTGINLGPE